MNRSKINQKANREIKKQMEKLKIYGCEVCGEPGWGLTIAHRHKRRWYYDKPDKILWHIKQWVIACIECHEKMERNKELTEKIFLKLRSEEDFPAEIRITENTQKETIEQAKRFKF